MRKLLLNIILLFVAVNVYSQQEALYSQYLFNPLVVNPAVAGSEDALSVLLLHRSQWIGFDGAPNTQTFSVHGPLGNKTAEIKSLGVGVHVVNDNIGPNSSLGTYGSVAYRMKLLNGIVAVGLRGGMLKYGVDWKSIDYNNSAEPYQGNTNNMFIPSFDFGLHYYTQEFFFGAAVSNLSQPKLSVNDLGNKIGAHMSRHWVITSGYQFKINESLQFKPAILMRYVKNTPLDFDINTNFLLYDKFWLGAGFRMGYGGILSAQYNITKNLKLGYAYDASFNKVRGALGGSHEIFLGYNFNKSQKPELPEEPDTLGPVVQIESQGELPYTVSDIAVEEISEVQPVPIIEGEPDEEKLIEVKEMDRREDIQPIEAPVATAIAESTKEIAAPFVEDVIVSAVKNEDGSYNYEFLPGYQTKLHLISENGSIIQTGSSNEMGFLQFKYFTSEENHRFQLDADESGEIDRILAILIDEEGNEQMVFAPKVRGNIYKYEIVPEEFEMHLLNMRGDTLETVSNSKNGFVFEEKPATGDYKLVLDKNSEEIRNANVTIGKDTRTGVSMQPGGSLNFSGDQQVEVISEGPELVTVIYFNDDGSEEIITFYRKEVDYDWARKHEKGNPDLNMINIDGDTLQSVSANQDEFYVFEFMPDDADITLIMDESDEEITNEIKVSVVGERIKKATRQEGSNNYVIRELSEEEITNVAIKRDYDVIPVMDEDDTEVLSQAFSNIEFDLGSDVLKWSSYETINHLGRILNSNPNWKLKLGGHADETGNDMVNLILSKKRVESIRDFLLRRDVNEDQIILRYFGEKYPIADNATEEGRTKNRRVELMLIKNKDK